MPCQTISRMSKSAVAQGELLGGSLFFNIWRLEVNKLFTIATVAFFGMVGAANASTLDVQLGSTGSDLSYSTGGTLSPNINLATTSGLTLDTNSQIINPVSSSPGNYKAPTGPIFDNNYLAVLGVPTTGQATFTLAGGQSNFGFTWGSIDTYNTLILTDSRNVTYTITGTNLLAQIAGSVNGTTQSDVIFSDAFGTIKSAVFQSTENAFEVANLGQSAVPLPASFPLFAAAFLGLALFGRRNARKA